MLKIINPEFFILILIIFIILKFQQKRRKEIFISFPLTFILVKNASKALLLKNFVNFLILLLIILALSNFQIINKIAQSNVRGINIILTLDTSGSMNAVDFEIHGRRLTRIEALKRVTLDFINRRVNDRIGLVVFGKVAITQCPLTLDHEILKEYVKNLEVGIAGDSTAIGDGLLLSIKRLRNVKGKKVIILVTDGRNNSGMIDPVTAALIAKNFNIKIYTIGIGTKGKPVPIYVKTPFGVQKIYINADLDDFTLKKISKITGGMYFNAKDYKNLKNIYTQIDKLEKTKFKVHYYFQRNYLYKYFLFGALFLLFFKLFIVNFKLDPLP